MEDLFKKFVNAGVGFVSLTTDRVQKTIDTLVKESKLSEQEGAKIMDELKKNGETKRKELEKQVQGLAAKMMKTVGVAPNADVEELKRTVKGGTKSSSTASTATKSSTASKAPASKTAATAKGAVASATSKAASTVKKAADKTSATASKTQKSAAGSAGAAKKEENKATGAAAASGNANS